MDIRDFLVCPYCGEKEDTDYEEYTEVDEFKVELSCHCYSCDKNWFEYFNMVYSHERDEEGEIIND